MIRTGSESDFFGVQQYCNYPEVSKNFKTCLLSDEEDQSFDSSSGLPSCTLDVSDTQSQQRVSRTRDVSPSLGNFLKLSLTSEEDEDTTDVEDDSHDSIEQISNKEENVDEEYQPMGQKYFGDKTNLDPEGWIKYASDSDPWNENLYSQFADENGALRYGILTLEEISKRSSNLIQLPDNKAFVFSRLHIDKMDLEDISVMSNCRYFLYIDMSHNLISDLNGLNHCNYLMYLNASHNKIKKVLDFQPPWFLTHVNLCCNEIKEIGTGNIAAFWSLKHLDLSYNLIEKIEGLEGLRYLKHLNLSHNYIQQVENLHCPSLQELNLSYNRITDIDNEDKCMGSLENLRELDLAHNNLTSLHNLENLKSLKSLNVSENKIKDFNEIYKLDGLKKLREIKMRGNGVCARQGYREFLIFKLSSLEVLDSVPVNFQERVASRMLWEPDVFTRKTHLRAKLELWNQLATQTVDITTTPYNDPPISLVALVGTFGSNKKDIAKSLEMKFPDQVGMM
ncbi:leucine-rich repeat-containing protein 23-like [Macrosteles quadrilineatus]|uniref:leucine-rich repeat-containing protein 23-like n=1 Tax=Macrosteles quadrilineatus TaxID=74068 RepID=UPI0023E12967|nr:leucine-rich repeat-containing protein 23-like [Macrosteles quadrilineatus]